MAVYGFDETKNKTEVETKESADDMRDKLNNTQSILSDNDHIIANTLSSIGATFVAIADMAEKIKNGDKPTASQVTEIRNTETLINNAVAKIKTIG